MIFFAYFPITISHIVCNFAQNNMITMKNKLKMGLFSLLFGISASCQQPTNQFESVNAATFANLIADPTVQILDVRTTEEYAEGHIANSKHLDVIQEDFLNKAKQELNKEQTVALYCRSGRRSKEAANLLSKEGFKVVELGGGFNEWKDTNHESVK